MKSSMLKKVKLNAVAGYMHFAISSLLVFFVSPFLVKFLGPSVFGIWKNIQAILSFASIADGRSTQALKWVIANDESFNDLDYKKQAVGSALKIWLYFLPFVTLIVFLLVYSLPVLINGLSENLHSLIYQVGFILGANLLLNPLLKIPDAILVGTNRGYKSTFVQIFFVIVSNLLMLLVSYFGYGLLGLSYVVLLVTTLNAFLIYWICKRNVSWFGLRNPTKTQVKEFFRFSFWVFIWSFVMKLILSTEIILIGYLISSEMVTNYVFSVYILQLAVSVALLTGSSVTPSLGKFIGAEDMDKSRVIVSSLREVITFIALFFGSLVILINRDFVTLWMGGDYFLGPYSNLLIVFSMLLLILTRLEDQVQDLSLNIKNKVIIGFVFSVLSAVLGMICFYYFDNRLEGLFIGILIGRMILNLLFTNMVNMMMDVKRNYTCLVFICISLLAVFQIEQYLPIANTWQNFTLKFVVVSVFLVPIYFIIFLSRSSKQNIYNYLIKVQKK